MSDIKESTSGFIITLHPLAILNVTDHFTRMKTQSSSGPSSSATIFGAVIGTQHGREIEIFNSYELPFKQTDAGYIIDNAYFLSKQEQFRQVFPTYDLLGWYSVGTHPTEQDLGVHKQFLEHNESPLFVQLDPSVNLAVAKDLPLSIFESVVDLGNVKFAKSKYKIETGEAERIALDHVARATNADSDHGSSLIANLTGQKNAIKMLYARVQVLKAYVRDVDNGVLPKNNKLLREIAAVCQRLPTISASDFSSNFIGDYNDILLTAYLAAITKGSHAVNELVDKINASTYDRKSMKGPRGIGMFM